MCSSCWSKVVFKVVNPWVKENRNSQNKRLSRILHAAPQSSWHNVSARIEHFQFDSSAQKTAPWEDIPAAEPGNKNIFIAYRLDGGFTWMIAIRSYSEGVGSHEAFISKWLLAKWPFSGSLWTQESWKVQCKPHNWLHCKNKIRC